MAIRDAALILTFMSLPGAVFAIICLVCILKTAIFYITKCIRKSKIIHLFTYKSSSNVRIVCLSVCYLLWHILCSTDAALAPLLASMGHDSVTLCPATLTPFPNNRPRYFHRVPFSVSVRWSRPPTPPLASGPLGRDPQLPTNP